MRRKKVGAHGFNHRVKRAGGTGWDTNGLRKQNPSLVGPPFLTIMIYSQSVQAVII